MNGLMMKAGIGTVLAATALTAAAPADAQRWRGGRYNGGDVAAAGLIGGVIGLGVGAAIADRGPYYGGGYAGYGGYYGPNYYYGPPAVVYRPRVYRPRVIYRPAYRAPYRFRGGYRGGYRW